MSTKGSNKGDGIVVKASLKLVREIAEKVLTDFTETIEMTDGTKVKGITEIKEGDQVVFRENIDPCPAVIAATKLGEDLWYVVSSTICPPTKCDDRQAMKCIRLEIQNLNIFQSNIAKKAEWNWVNEWRDISEHPRAQRIIDKATKKWTH